MHNIESQARTTITQLQAEATSVLDLIYKRVNANPDDEWDLFLTEGLLKKRVKDGKKQKGNKKDSR